MRYRTFGRTGWQVSEIGYGMWGMGSWSGSDDEESLAALERAVDLGCNFFDTAWAYGEGRSEKLLGEVIRANSTKRLYTATKIPPKNLQWPSRRGSTLDDCFPPDHIDSYVHSSLENSGLDSFDLIQFHVWEDAWVEDDRWAKKIDELRSAGLIKAVGISINRWEPWNGVRTVKSGLIDSVQVIYNIFDQNPEDDLFPACVEMDTAVIARVPFDEGSLTGALTKVYGAVEQSGLKHNELWSYEIKGGKLKYEGGSIAVPTAPGLGVTLDRDKLAEYSELYKRLGSYPYDQDPLRPGWTPTIPNDRWADPMDARRPTNIIL